MMTLLVPIMCLILAKDGVLAEDGKIFTYYSFEDEILVQIASASNGG